MLDDLPVEQIRPFEGELYKYLDTSQAGLLQELREKKAMDDQLKAKINARAEGIQGALRGSA